jgi:hypothetical protein
LEDQTKHTRKNKNKRVQSRKGVKAEVKRWENKLYRAWVKDRINKNDYDALSTSKNIKVFDPWFID